MKQLPIHENQGESSGNVSNDVMLKTNMRSGPWLAGQKQRGVLVLTVNLKIFDRKRSLNSRQRCCCVSDGVSIVKQLFHAATMKVALGGC